MSNDLFEKSIKELMKTALKDGNISPDEYEIIEQAKVDIDSYNLHLQDALEDGQITEAEQKRLNELRELIIERADIIAKLDDTLSSDEEVLIDTLKRFIKNNFA